MAMALNLLKALVLLLEAPAARQDALANCLKPTKHMRPNRRRRFYLALLIGRLFLCFLAMNSSVV
jgi:hypothetical protein